jgi:hypothetical protein
MRHRIELTGSGPGLVTPVSGVINGYLIAPTFPPGVTIGVSRNRSLPVEEDVQTAMEGSPRVSVRPLRCGPFARRGAIHSYESLRNPGPTLVRLRAMARLEEGPSRS